MAPPTRKDGADPALDTAAPADGVQASPADGANPEFNKTFKAAVDKAVTCSLLSPFDGDCAPVITDVTGNDRITKLPVDFSGIPEERLKQMNETAYKLIEKYMKGTTPTGGPDGMLSFNDIGDIMKEIAKMDDLTEVEKCRLWSEVRNVMQERKVPVLDADEKKEMIDSWKGASDPWHALITLNDGYHGNRLVNMSPEDATRAIQEHENGAEADSMGFFRGLLWRGAKLVYGVNQGDINASEGQLRALRELRRGGTFAHYADEWHKQFVRSDRDRFGYPR